MAKINQFGGGAGGPAGDTAGCLPFEAMLADAIDGTLSADDQRLFDEHLLTCGNCPAMLADAQRGAALLEMLRPETPKPSTALVDRILAQTSVLRAREEEGLRAERRAASEAASLLGRPVASVQPSPALFPAPAGKVLPFRERLQARLHVARVTVLQPRFAMTAAMAFFSIALTLNLTGVRLSDLRTSDLRPANVKRGVYEARARVVRYYANLRVVYELESRVRDLQRASDDGGTAEHTTQAGTEAQHDSKPVTASPSGGGSGTAPSPRSGSPAPEQNKAPDQPKSSRPKPGPGNSRCIWPNRGMEVVALREGEQHGRIPADSFVSTLYAAMPREKRGRV